MKVQTRIAVRLLLVLSALTACSGDPTAAPTPQPSAPPKTTAPPPTATAPVLLPDPTATPAPTATPGVIFIQDFSIAISGEAFGNLDDVRDGNSATFASARGGGHGVWTFDLGSEQTVAGVTVYPVIDSGDQPYLTAIEVSGGGATWQTVFVGSGNCGVPQCDALPDGQYTVLTFEFVTARFVRLVAGPRWLALAEVLIGIVGQ